MNCLIWVLLLLSCRNNGSCFDSGCGCGRERNECRERGRGNDGCGCGRGNDGCGCGRGNDGCGCGSMNDGCGSERQNDNDCGCRTEFRSEPRFEQRPFVFNQNAGCGCDES